MVRLTDALAYGDERYEAGIAMIRSEFEVVTTIDLVKALSERYEEGLRAAAKEMCPYCQTMESVPIDEPFQLNGYWRHSGGINCAAGPIHAAIAAMKAKGE